MFFHTAWTRPPFGATGQIPTETPVGTVLPYAGQLEQALLQVQGWLYCDGSEVDKVEYSELYLAIGDTYGTAASSDQFVLPDYQGYFLRGLATNDSQDPGIDDRVDAAGQKSKAVGSTQTDQFQEHEHCYDALASEGTPSVTVNVSPQGVAELPTQSQASSSITAESQAGDPCTPSPGGSDAPRYGTETRPKNIYVYYLIKARHDLRLLGVPAWPVAP